MSVKVNGIQMFVATSVLAAGQALAQAPAPTAAPTATPTTVAQVEQGMTMPEAIRYAVTHSGLVQAAHAGTDALQARLLEAWSLSFPHVDYKTFLAPMPGEVGDAIQGHTDYSHWGVFTLTEVTAYVPVYTFNKLSNLRAAARLGVDVGRAQEAIAVAEVRFRVQKAYFALSFTRELSSIIDEGKGYLDKARARIEELEKADDPSYDPVDRLKFRVYEAQVTARELEAKRAGALAEAALKVVIGMVPDAPATFVAGKPRPVRPTAEPVMKEVVDRAVEQRPELLALRTGIKARTAEVAARLSAFFPDLVVVGQFRYGYSNVAQPQPSPFAVDPFNTYSGGGGVALRGDLEIGKKIGELREARANLAKLDAEAAEAERGVRLEVEQLWREMTDARALVDAQKDAMQAARGWVIAKTDLYENGLAEINDVMTGLVNFFQTRMDYQKSIHDYNVAIAALERATGMDLVPPGAVDPLPGE